MALVHATRPSFGVQFHPESICTSFGAQLVHNFLALALTARPSLPKAPRAQSEPHSNGHTAAAGEPQSPPFGLTWSAAHPVVFPSPCGRVDLTTCRILCLSTDKHPFRQECCTPAYGAAL